MRAVTLRWASTAHHAWCSYQVIRRELFRLELATMPMFWTLLRRGLVPAIVTVAINVLCSSLGLIVISGLSNWSDIPVATQKLTVRCMLICDICLSVSVCLLGYMLICSVCFFVNAPCKIDIITVILVNKYTSHRSTLALSQFLTWRINPVQPIEKTDVSNKKAEINMHHSCWH